MSTGEPNVNATSAQRIGRYVVLRKLAQGGMAEIYLARARGIHGFEKLVVLKRVLPHLLDDARFVSMFLDEARLVARLHHQNIAQVFDIGDDDGECFFSMEYVHGQDLRSIARRAKATGTPMPLELGLGIVIQVAAGLHYAHEQTDPTGAPLGVVHRDVSPSNVLVSYDGAVKLVDFGVAKAERRTEKTATGTIKGKFAYMSPEQAWGHDIDRRSDVFALATLLWEVTTGRRLFYRDTDVAMMAAICFDDIPTPSSVIPGYPKVLERIVMSGLHKDRDQRYQTAQQLQVELEELCREHRLSTSPVKRAAFLESLFANEILSWQAASRQGVSLAEHVSQLTPSAATHLRSNPQTASKVAPAVQRAPPEPVPEPVPEPEASELGTLDVEQPAPTRHRRNTLVAAALAIASGVLVLMLYTLATGGQDDAEPAATTATGDAGARAMPSDAASPPAVDAALPADSAVAETRTPPPDAAPTVRQPAKSRRRDYRRRRRPTPPRKAIDKPPQPAPRPEKSPARDHDPDAPTLP